MENDNENDKTKESDDDLEDGEIESEDDDSCIVINDSPSIATPPPKISSEQITEENLSSPQKKSSNTSAEICNLEKINPEKSPNSISQSEIGKSKKNSHQIFDDDFAGNIESALAAVLKKDGIEPLPLPKIEKRDDYLDKLADEQTTRVKSKKRKRRDHDEVKKKKRNKTKNDEINDTEVNDDIDDYEMLCIRGGSPPPQSRIACEDLSSNLMYTPQPFPHFYDSDDSYSSYNSYDSTEYRKEKRHIRLKSKERKQHKGGRGGREKRRNRDDSDNGDDNSKGQDQKTGQRKMELCKFYLMECCAKREKCLYMHGDFPCKYYYLGMECVFKGSCKFSHGKPLTEELRNILLKHIETAPKEILGNFRRISRENATILLNQTHLKLCEEHGVENTLVGIIPEVENTISNSPTFGISNSQQTNKCAISPNNTKNNNGIPSLLDMVINPPNISPRKDDKDKLNKSDKPRKSRWCDNIGTPPLINPNLMSIPPPLMGTPIPPTSLLPPLQLSTNRTTNTAANNQSTNILSLQNLSGVLASEQIEKLSAIGVETLEQINQLTVAQLNELGLSISQIHEIQLNALSIQKLGLISQSTSATSTFSPTTNVSDTKTQKSLLTTDTDSNLQTPKKSTTAEDVNSNSLKKNNQDIDMRYIGAPFTSVNDISKKLDTDASNPIKLVCTTSDVTLTDVGIASPDPIPFSGKTTQEKESNSTIYDQEQTSSVGLSSNQMVDFSQYLKDSHLDTEKDLNLNNLLNDDKDDEVLNEDEPELLIDESWCPSEDENTKNEVFSNTSDAEQTVDGDNTTDTDTKTDEESETNLYPFTAIYDPKSLLPSSMITNKIDEDKSSSEKDDNKNSLLSESNDISQLEFQINEQMNDEVSNRNLRQFSEPREFRSDPRLDYFKKQPPSTPLYNDDSEENWDNDSNDNVTMTRTKSPPNHFVKIDDTDNWDDIFSTPAVDKNEAAPLYNRTSIYDGTSKTSEEESLMTKKADKDMRMSLFLGRFSDSSNSDIDLRLPFKPVMTNYVPATEIDCSFNSHAPITYKMIEVEIPKPDYDEIRRNMPVTEKTLDPRLRRIFCLKEAIIDLTENTDCDIPSFSTRLLSDYRTGGFTNFLSDGPRTDPRRKREQEILSGNSPMSVSGTNNDSNKPQNSDIRILLQKSDWYKNLSSKNKIMVNQQLAILSSALKKFHQDPTPNKVFDMGLIATNPSLQHILQNLGLFIDANTNFKHVDDMQDNESNVPPGLQANNMLGLMSLLDNVQGGGGTPFDFLLNSSSMNMNRHFMGNPMPPFGPMFGDVKPGLLGIAPGMNFNTNDLGFLGNTNFGGNNSDNRQGGNPGGGNSGGNGNRGNRNFRQGNNNNNNNSNNRNNGNDRWSGNNNNNNNSSNSGSRNNNNNRRNYDNRRNRDSRRDKSQNS